MLKLKLEITKIINIRKIAFSSIEDLSNYTINKLLFELKNQIQPLIALPIKIRRRHVKNQISKCPYCKKKFKGSKGVNRHISLKHPETVSSQPVLYLSAHKVRSSKSYFLYFILYNPMDRSFQVITKFKFSKCSKAVSKYFI